MAKFQKGQSGNPGGRPVGLERALKEQVAGEVPALIEGLLEIALGKKDDATGKRAGSDASPKDKREATIAVLDRVLGKPRQAVDVTTDGESVAPTVLALDVKNLPMADLVRLREALGRKPGR